MGAIGRDDSGFFCAAAAEVMRRQILVLLAEGLGLRNDQKLAVELDISHIEVEVDSLVLVHYLKMTDRPISTLGSIMEDIDFCTRHFDCFHFNFSPRATKR